MPKIIAVGDMVYKKGNYYSLDSDYGLVSEVVKDKYTGTKYLKVYWLYDAVSETIMEDEVSLYKKSVKAYGKFNKNLHDFFTYFKNCFKHFFNSFNKMVLARFCPVLKIHFYNLSHKWVN